MWSATSSNTQPTTQTEGVPQRSHAGHGRLLLWLIVPVLLVSAIPAVRFASTAEPAPAPQAATYVAHASTAQGLPADRFMQSVVADDGALGWQQLCPSAQAQVTRDELVHQALLQRTAATQAGLRLNVDFIGARPRPEGGELRLYVVTAHWLSGATQLRTYSVQTQSSGCVADVQHQ